ncbi:peptide chain release factor N(5)-glutamine methyltransferase [Paenochrobactrum sp. BZR 588]|uniref:peptide chain release factor N(5)-glutamine methyltransferase n=1 Tax=Paenochrobactrum TaxID=999488 RepID=UPI0035BC7841
MSKADVMQLGQMFAQMRDTFQAAGLENPAFDARLLTEWATVTSRMDMISRPEQVIDEEKIALWQSALERRLNGEPVYRIIGSRAFWGLEFQLSKETLEPRPDTEALIELVLPVLQKKADDKQVVDVLDMGTGTGIIAITLLHQCAKARCVAVDIAHDALSTARINAENAGVSSRFAAIHSDWFANVSGRYDMITSNPPYIPHHEIAALSREVKEYDPVAALDGGADGLDFYRALAQHGANHLYEDGVIAIEIGAGQLSDVELIFNHYDFKLACSNKDLGGHERALLFEKA